MIAKQKDWNLCTWYRTKIAKLLRFPSSNSNDKLTSLDDYISRCKPGQDNIYFLSAENRQVAQNSPFVERLVNKGYEVSVAHLKFIEPTLSGINIMKGLSLIVFGAWSIVIINSESCTFIFWEYQQVIRSPSVMISSSKTLDLSPAA